MSKDYLLTIYHYVTPSTTYYSYISSVDEIPYISN